MVWLILVLAAVLIIGPVMYMVPSARDKRLAALRETARRQGLTVKIAHIAKLDPEAAERVSAGGELKVPRTPCVAYQVSMSGIPAELGEILLIKIPSQPTVPVDPVLPGWSLDTSSSRDFLHRYMQPGPPAAAGPGAAGSRKIVQQTLAALPPDTLGFGITSRHVACYWLEKPPAAAADDGAVESAVQQQLQQMKAALDTVVKDLYARFGEET